MRNLLKLVVVAALLPSLGGCMAMAVGGAVVGAGAAVASTAVGAGVAVGKGAYNVVTYPFSDSEKDKK
jgi:hypothetical protein